MKKIIVICLLMLSLQNSYGQNDTLQQQKTIASNILKYIGQPFSVLYNDLSIKPKTIRGIISSKNKDIERANKFFYEPQDSINEDIYLYIEFESLLPISEAQKYQPYFLRVFNAQEYTTYQNLVIKKLEIYPLFKTIM